MESGAALCRRALQTACSRPLAQVANQLQGSLVVDDEGNRVGEISEIMTIGPRRRLIPFCREPSLEPRV